METKIQAQMRKWIIDFIILWIVKSKWETYWAEIIEILKNSDLIVVEGTIYPLLSRLKKDEIITYRWEESESWHPRKYYSLTKNWENAFDLMLTSWGEIKASVFKILEK